MPVRTQPCVLVVEDETELRELVAESLSKEGFVVAEAPTGAGADGAGGGRDGAGRGWRGSWT